MAFFRSDFSLSNFIRNAKAHGLPTSFLETVQSEVVLSSSGVGADMFQPMLPPFLPRRLSLSDTTLESVQEMSLAFPKGEANGIEAIYHEGTHAYISLKKADPEVIAIIDTGKAHYRKAALSDQTKADDEERIAHEALGEYVGHRASAFWRTAELIFFRQQDVKQGKVSGYFREKLRAIPKLYEREMGLRVFGYQTKGLLWNQRQLETKAAIPGKLKEFCDRVILENVIPDQFARVKRFADPYRAICRGLPGFQCPF